MGKRYYCDYCDKSFGDRGNNRKNHLKGLIHQQNKKAHYDKFRDPQIILAEEKAKRPCKHFFNSGTCTFSDNCRFSHLTDEEKDKLEQQIRYGKEKEKSVAAKKQKAMPTLKDWLEKKEKKTKSKVKSKVTLQSVKSDSGVTLPVYSLPPCLQGQVNIPPSLLPPPPDVYKTLPLQEWG